MVKAVGMPDLQQEPVGLLDLFESRGILNFKNGVIGLHPGCSNTINMGISCLPNEKEKRSESL
jgi:hypothetical protein